MRALVPQTQGAVVLRNAIGWFGCEAPMQNVGRAQAFDAVLRGVALRREAMGLLQGRQVPGVAFGAHVTAANGHLGGLYAAV